MLWLSRTDMLADAYFPAFKAPIREAHALGVMCSYNSLQGIPTCLSPLLRNAREQWTGKRPWGGYVTSDSDSVDDATRTHHYTKSPAEAACEAIRDGGDDINSGNTYLNHLLQGVAEGDCSMRDVDAALHNTLRLRFQLGLFESKATRCTLPWHSFDSGDIGTTTSAALNLRAASESLVLLKNRNHTLPLRAGGSIAVVGPHGNATRFMVSFSSGPVCADGSFDCVISPFEAICAINGDAGGTTTYDQGSRLVEADSEAMMDTAVAAAASADVAVLGLGIGMLGCFANHENCWNDHGPCKCDRQKPVPCPVKSRTISSR
jgi:beta-glucosidase-like glycosyl hydrolase